MHTTVYNDCYKEQENNYFDLLDEAFVVLYSVSKFVDKFLGKQQ